MRAAVNARRARRLVGGGAGRLVRRGLRLAEAAVAPPADAQRREQAAVLQAEMRARKQKLAEMQRRNRELRHVVACEANRYDWRPAVL